MRRTGQRYFAALVAFAVSALWTGLPIGAAFECFLFAGLVSAVVGVVQRRQRTKAREARRQQPSPRTSPAATDVSSEAWPFAAERR